MNLPLLAKVLNTIASLELAIILVLASALIVLWLRLRSLESGISWLTDNLKKNPMPTGRELAKQSGNQTLSELARATLDTVAEADLDKASSDGIRRIQKFLLDQVKDALFIVDDLQEIRFANAASKTMFGEEKEFEGRQLIEACLDHRFSETVGLALETGSPIQDQIKMPNDSRTLFLDAGPIDPSYNIGTGAWLMVRDITAELHTEQVRKDFVANASHELRTPLSIIKGYLEMLEEDPRHANAVKVMTKHTDRLSRIVEDMLMISRIESDDGDQLKKAALFDIGDCVYDMVDQLQTMIEDQGAKVKVQLPPEPTERQFYGDRFYWDQIFFNLIENALKQNPNHPNLKIWVVVERDIISDRFNIQIIDNGVGIPAPDLPEVFKRFYRVEKSHSQKIKGTGLGLSIVKRAVEAHHGFISVESQPGTKTEFFISVPGPPVNAGEGALT